MATNGNNREDISEAQLDHDEDYLFTRKADQYMVIDLDPKTENWSLIKDPSAGPSGQQWGEVRFTRELMHLTGVKLITSTTDNLTSNPYTDDLLDDISEALVGEYDDIAMMACDLF